MKTIKKENFNGEYIDLDNYISYQKLMYDHDKYFDKYKRYYFYCKNGIKSKYVCEYLENLGYDVTKIV